MDPCGSYTTFIYFDIPVIFQWPLGVVMFSHAVFFCVNTSFSLALEGVLKGLLADERLTPLQRCFPRVGPNGTEYVPSMDTWYIYCPVFLFKINMRLNSKLKEVAYWHTTFIIIITIIIIIVIYDILYIRIYILYYIYILSVSFDCLTFVAPQCTGNFCNFLARF